jgi:hypothetical protein
MEETSHKYIQNLDNFILVYSDLIFSSCYLQYPSFMNINLLTRVVLHVDEVFVQRQHQAALHVLTIPLY